MNNVTEKNSDFLQLIKSKINTGVKALSIAAVAGALLTMPATAKAADITNLGHLNDSYHKAIATGISGDGSTVIGLSRNSDDKYEAFSWTRDDGMKSLGTLGSYGSFANEVSGNGTVIGGYSKNSSGIKEAFSWTADTGMKAYGSIIGASEHSTTAITAVSANGSVLAGDIGGYGFVWSEEKGRTDIGSLFSYLKMSFVEDISADGTTVVGYSRNSSMKEEAFIWTEEDGMTGLGYLDGTGSQAKAISSDKNSVVGYFTNSDGNDEAFIWDDADGMAGLGTLGGAFSDALAVSADGAVVAGWSDNSEEEREAFVWTEDLGMMSLWDLLEEAGVDLDGWERLTKVTGLSDDGKIFVGQGYYLEGDRWVTSAFKIDLDLNQISTVPIPGTLLLLGSGLMGLLGLCRRKR